MNELDLIIGRSNLNLIIEQLDQWNDKKPNEKLTFWKGKMLETELTFRHMENELRTSRQRNAELEAKFLELKQENQTLTDQNERLKQGV